MADFATLADALVQEFSQARHKHANTLILTLYGDTINPHGGTIWLGHLIKLVEPLGINQRLVRTSVYRLSEKGIMQSRQKGRRSYYSLTERGYRQYQSAEMRIYVTALPLWDGRWRLVMIPSGGMGSKRRETVDKELLWLGFNRLASGVYVHPTADMQELNTMLADQKVSEHVVVLHAENGVDGHTHSDQLLMQCMGSKATDQAYQIFVDTYAPILQAAYTSPLNPERCFLVRTLLINHYRVILLHEPELPAGLLPKNALTLQARQITQALYLRICQLSDAHYLQVVQKRTPINLPKEYVKRYAME